MRRSYLCLCLVLALSCQSALGLLSPQLRPSHCTRPQQPVHHLSSSSCVRTRCTRRLAPSLSSSGLLRPRPRCLRPSTLSALVAVGSSAATTMGSSGSSPLGDLARRRVRSASTALSLSAGNGVQGEERGDGAGGDAGKDGWRQRMVRTILTVFLRMRALVAAVGSMLGLGRPSKGQSASNRSLFRGGGRGGDSSQAVGGGAPSRRGLSRLATKRTVVLLVMLMASLTARYASMRMPSVTEVPMSTFMQLMEGKRGKTVVDGVRVTKTGKMFFRMNGEICYTQPLRVTREVFNALSNSGIPYTAAKTAPVASRTLSSLFPIAYICAIYFFVFKKGQRDMVGSTGKLASSSDLDRSLTFGDVAGVDQAKRQVQELVSMIQNPGPFVAAGARLPSGLLMVGPPGTGKTLMARVMASEAGVPFYYCSGSDFVEMYVGRGAARVRKLFLKAAKTAPCIVFLDELDALGKERSSGGGGRQTNDEAEQTLNQLLASMDGLDTNNNGVMVIAATNRYEVLDNALTRPGRFDRVVRVDVPDVDGREEILKVHTRKMKVDQTADLRAVAEITPGLAGAELATIANEAAISAARRGSQSLVQSDFLDSVQNFYISRKKGVAGLQDMLKGMLN